MGPYQPRSGREAAASQEQLWTAVLDCRPLAGLKLAADDLREQARAEALLSRMLADAKVVAPRPAVGAARRWLGAALVWAGERLQGTWRAAPGPAVPEGLA